MQPRRSVPNCSLTVAISQLEIESFGGAFEGDYVCRVVVINETSGEVEQELQPLACVRLLLEPNPIQNCGERGERPMWRCADIDHRTEQCPQQFSPYPVTSRVTQISSSISLRSTTSLHILSTITSVYSLIVPSASVSSAVLFGPTTSTSYSPTTTLPGVPKWPRETVYTYVSLAVLTPIAVVGIAVITVTCMQYIKRLVYICVCVHYTCVKTY